MFDPQAVDGLSGPGSDWWAIYTRHQHERVVADMLSAKGFEIFLPAYDSIRRWKDRQKILSLPLFPCYVFVKGAFNRRVQVVSTPGVHMILSHGERAAVIPENEIAAIRQTLEGHFRVEPHPFLRCGERVRVTRGSLQGVEGILVRKRVSSDWCFQWTCWQSPWPSKSMLRTWSQLASQLIVEEPSACVVSPCRAARAWPGSRLA